MYKNPHTWWQRAENRDDAAADADQDYNEPNGMTVEQMDDEYYADMRRRMIEIGGMSPDEADIEILKRRGKNRAA